MFETLFVIFGALLAVSAVPLAWIAIRNTLRERGPRVITCPENGCRAEVEVSAWNSGLAAAFGESRHRLAACSRWPEMEGCDQACVSEIEATPGGCLVRSIVADWYRGRNCAYCGRAIPETHAGDRRPGFRSADGRTLAVAEVEPVRLGEVLPTAQAVCPNCYDAMSFREHFPGVPIVRTKPESQPLSTH
jgi:hypothetical protein